MLDSRAAPLADPLVLAPGVVLARARVHEVAGPARTSFALVAAAALGGPLLWLQPHWETERLMGDGVRDFLDPARLVIGRARTATELLWSAEEALRTGLVPLVVIELPDPPGLTVVRRLHLAAEAGAAGAGAPLALLLTPDSGGAPGVETRWQVAPLPGWAGDGAPRWRLQRARARLAPEACWEARWEAGRLLLDPLLPAP